MPHHLDTDADLKKGLRALTRRDPRLKDVLARARTVTLRRREGGFSGLCAIITGQQLSTASAGAIWARLAAAFDPFHHDAVRMARPEKLARLGLSQGKIKTMKALSAAVTKGHIDLNAIADIPADEAHTALVALHGIGPWTADIYLLFCLGNADAFPAGDLALQEAVRIAFKLRARPDARRLTQIAEQWRPWRGVAAHLLWAYYREIKNRDPVPPNPKHDGVYDGRRT